MARHTYNPTTGEVVSEDKVFKVNGRESEANLSCTRKPCLKDAQNEAGRADSAVKGTGC